MIGRDNDGLPVISDEQIALARSMNDNTLLNLKRSKGKAISIVIRDQMFRHYFHFMETLLILFATQQEYFPFQNVDKIIFGSFDWNNPLQAGVQSELLKLLFPDAIILTDLGFANDPIENVILIDRGLCHTDINKMIEPVLFMVVKWGPALRALVYSALGLEYRSRGEIGKSPRSIYVPRKPPRTLALEAEEKVLGILSEMTSLSTVDFTGMSWPDQVRCCAKSDVMIGVHGNGLTNLLWLPPHATVIEIFPEGVHHYDYQMMAEIVHLDYFGLEGSRIFPPFSRFGPAYGHDGGSNRPVTNVYLDNLRLALSASELSLNLRIP